MSHPLTRFCCCDSSSDLCIRCSTGTGTSTWTVTFEDVVLNCSGGGFPLGGPVGLGVNGTYTLTQFSNNNYCQWQHHATALGGGVLWHRYIILWLFDDRWELEVFYSAAGETAANTRRWAFGQCGTAPVKPIQREWAHGETVPFDCETAILPVDNGLTVCAECNYDPLGPEYHFIVGRLGTATAIINEGT
jgi:hypothetical protein